MKIVWSQMTYTTQTNTQIPRAITTTHLPVPPPPTTTWQMFERVRITHPKCMSCHGAT